jgi:hypothetical protein
MMKVEIKEVKISEIKLNPDNPRRISKQDMDRLVKSLNEFPDMLNIREIVVDETMTILGGNMRYLALKKSGAKAATAKIVTGLTKEQKREFVIKDNSNFGEYDFDALANGWSDLPLADWGVDLPEDWLGGVAQEPQDAEPQMDKAAELNKIWKVKTGDLWQIGEHRLLCGDSTKKEDVGRVMGGEKAELCLTDPPYATGGKSEDYDVFIGDLPKLIDCFLPLAKDVSNRILLTPGNAHQFLYPKPDWVLAWFVQAGVGANPWGFTFWNAIFAYGKDPYLARRLGSRPDAFVKTEASDKTEHSTSKPVGVWSWILERGSVDAGDIIFDPFIGSGTTMVACQNLNRKCRGIEISENYCAVILQRMTDAFPGIEIKKVK